MIYVLLHSVYLVYLQKLKDLGKITVLQRSDKRRVLYFKDTSADVEYNVDEGMYLHVCLLERSHLFGRYKNVPVSTRGVFGGLSHPLFFELLLKKAKMTVNE